MTTRNDKDVKVDLQDIRKGVKRVLAKKHYSVSLADSPPAGTRWIMLISLLSLQGRVPDASVAGEIM